MSTLNPSVPAADSGLAEQVNRLTRQIAQQESAIYRSTRVMGSIGLIGLVLIAGYYYYGYKEIARLLEPNTLVPFAAGMLEQRLPEAREALVVQISKSAPAWAEQVSLKAQQAIPDLRVKLEDYVLSETDKMAQQVTTLTEEKIQKVLHENREVVEKGFKELADSDNLSEETLAVLVTALEKELQTDMQAQAGEVLETLRFLSGRVQRLADGKDLDDEEQSERRIAMLARRLQLTEADPSPITMPDYKKLTATKVAADNGTPGDKSATENDTPADTDGKSEDKTGEQSKS